MSLAAKPYVQPFPAAIHARLGLMLRRLDAEDRVAFLRTFVQPLLAIARPLAAEEASDFHEEFDTLASLAEQAAVNPDSDSLIACHRAFIDLGVKLGGVHWTDADAPWARGAMFMLASVASAGWSAHPYNFDGLERACDYLTRAGASASAILNVIHEGCDAHEAVARDARLADLEHKRKLDRAFGRPLNVPPTRAELTERLAELRRDVHLLESELSGLGEG